MSDLTVVIWFFVVVATVYYWWRALMAKEVALRAAARHCKEMDIQLLDQSVYLRRLWFKRNHKGALSLWRAFYFEFTSTGEDRYTGRVIMLGRRIEQVELDPHRVH
ncbi:DUF3301 domain-containing protein [Gilvimarinus agarilyticus]|uniref:DUF3301 domain-containing protein n=1 Tax=unclassified Gilvimarinus TaxID=2642066 RepID=UPI001C09B7D1|nr:MULTISPECIES: DUF3301 domain-containing protein [unclassified Gilvimarinus]MBU2885793.1 DUF3301 domain-containing protein [Gilvimarinus agarilyticus]MDO6570647.1 DUF3301 domain-containing protein [Gilvimarinus sp. 2_MG-2023]MDO6746688.1 DUF3301 domain-containing protein [Gilvimarinus sp. 1_MG-2023]